MIFAGNSNRPLAQRIVDRLRMPLGKAQVGRFSDGEVAVEIDENVRGKDVFILQSTCAPTNDNLLELLIMADAVKRASAGRITAVIPYYGYARQDRRPRSARVPISAKVVADVITAAGFHRVLTVDLHADQIQGFFNMPVDNVYSSPVLVADALARNFGSLGSLGSLGTGSGASGDMVVVSPDVGGVVRARAIAKQLDDADLAIIDKRRPKANEAQVMHIIGDVEGRPCVIVDDIVDTAGTLCKAAAALKDCGATRVAAYCTHPVLSGAAVERIAQSALDELVVTDTIALRPDAQACERIRQLSLDELLAEAIRRVSNEESISAMFH